MGIRVVPIDDTIDETFDRLIALRDEGVRAVAIEAWPAAGDGFRIQMAGPAEHGDLVWQFDVGRVGSHAAEFRLEQPYMTSPGDDPATGFVVWGDAGVVLALDFLDIQECFVSAASSTATPDELSFWVDLLDHILITLYEDRSPIVWDLSGQDEPELTRIAGDAPADDFEVEVSDTQWRVHIASISYGTVQCTLSTADASGRREIDAYIFAFSGHGAAQVVFNDPLSGTYGALAVPFEMSSNYEFYETPSRLADLARVTIKGLLGDVGQRVVLQRSAGTG